MFFREILIINVLRFLLGFQYDIFDEIILRGHIEDIIYYIEITTENWIFYKMIFAESSQYFNHKLTIL